MLELISKVSLIISGNKCLTWSNSAEVKSDVGGCQVPLHCNHFQVHSGLEW